MIAWIQVPSDLVSREDSICKDMIDELVRWRVIEKRTIKKIEAIRFTDDFIDYYLSDDIKSVAISALKDYESRNQWIAERETTAFGEKAKIGRIAEMKDSVFDKQRKLSTIIMNNALYRYLVKTDANDNNIMNKEKLFYLAECAGTLMDLTPGLRNAHKLREAVDNNDR